MLPDDRAVYGLLPFIQPQTENIHFSQPIALAAMAATNTVTAKLNHYFLPDSHVLFVLPAAAIHQSDVQNVLQQSFYALGCARAGLDVVQRSQQPALPFVQTAYQALAEELQTCRVAIYAAVEQPFSDRLQLRARAIELAVRCAHAAVVVSAGAANSLAHPAQRIYREALVLTVAGQTPAVMAATLSQLTRSHRTDA